MIQPPGRRQWRQCGAFAAALLLMGCGSSKNGVYQQYAQMLKQSLGGFSGRVSREQAAAIPYASLAYRLDGSNQTILVLATDTGGDQLWTASNHVVFQTRNGRIVRTVGLPQNLAALIPQSAQGLSPPADALRQTITSTRLADFPEQGLYSLQLTCTAMARGPQNVTILGQAISTIRVDESCKNQKMDWRFMDSYWIDPQSGFVWRSIQHIGPKGQKVETEILRPPG